jgi:hypothetical protein
MIPFCSGNAVLTLANGRASGPEPLNEDHAWHLKNTPAPAPDPWLMRLLPGFVRTPLKARIAERQYEDSLIALWENSPHLLADIGVVLSTKGTLPEDHVAAPDRVIDHVMAAVAEASAATAVLGRPEPETPAPARPAPVRMRRPQQAMPAGLPA